MDMNLSEFRKVLNVLEPFPEAVCRLDKWGSPYKSQKAHVLIWYAAQDTTGGGAYTRQKGNSSARTCYNRLLNPGMLVWMAAVLGADERDIERATSAAIDAEKINFRKRCAAFREIITFDDIIRLMDVPERWQFDPALDGLYSIDEKKQPNPIKGKKAQFNRILKEELEND